MKAILVANLAAGKFRGAAAAARLAAGLRDAGLDVETLDATGAENVPAALSRALRGNPPHDTRVVVAGGDGTIHAALPALRGTGYRMAILPVGSVNVLARELGIPAAPDQAIRLAAAGRLRPIDLGLANGVPFALMAGIGFDAAVVRSVEPRIKSIVGALAYIARGLSVLSKYPPSRFAVTADGQRFDGDAWLAVVANAARYTYHWRLAPAATIDDGWLDMCLFESRSRAQTFRQVLAALRGRHAGRPGVHHLRARRFHIQCDPPVSVQLDGDAAGQTPLDLDILPGALTVVVPR